MADEQLFAVYDAIGMKTGFLALTDKPALIHLDPMVAAAYSVAMDEASPDAARTAPRDALVSNSLIGVAVFHL
ncbi:MAG TPA: hypothetical protein VGS16_01545, partial [Candidatus Dormibacteraeota bacterium]|nr:hypothetical protein [Candidatus Dormibacteraeota bacterium]